MKRWKKWAIVGLLAGAMGYAGYHQRYVNDIFPARLTQSHFFHSPKNKPISGREIVPLPNHAPIIPEAKGKCPRYVVMIAKKYFGINYKPADAWRFAKQNKLVWRSNKSKNNFREVIRPGHVLGIRWGDSEHYSSHAHWARRYTHTFFVWRRDGDKITVVHNFGNEFRIGKLEDELKKINGKIIDVIEPGAE